MNWNVEGFCRTSPIEITWSFITLDNFLQFSPWVTSEFHRVFRNNFSLNIPCSDSHYFSRDMRAGHLSEMSARANHLEALCSSSLSFYPFFMSSVSFTMGNFQLEVLLLHCGGVSVTSWGAVSFVLCEWGDYSFQPFSISLVSFFSGIDFVVDLNSWGCWYIHCIEVLV